MQKAKETQVPSLNPEESLEEEMTTPSSILVWKLPWTEESGGLQSMGLKKVRNDRTLRQHKSLVQQTKKPKKPNYLKNRNWIQKTIVVPGGSDCEESACNAGDPDSIPGQEENAYPLQHPCLENSKDRGDWQDTFPGLAKSQT